MEKFIGLSGPQDCNETLFYRLHLPNKGWLFGEILAACGDEPVAPGRMGNMRSHAHRRAGQRSRSPAKTARKPE